MSKYVVIGGFLGAGKTTSMIAFSQYLENIGIKPAILVNDLGTQNLVDSKTTEMFGNVAFSEIAGDCICYQTEALVSKLRYFRDTEKADIVFSDIPGCGIGALDHVYHTLNRDYTDEFSLCPFVTVADPERIRTIMPNRLDINLPKEMDFLFDAQLKEAEVILLNKIDTLTVEEKDILLEFIEKKYSQAKVFPMSAKTGQGIKEAVDYLFTHSSSLPKPDIGYGGSDFIAAEKKLCWCNRNVYVKRRDLFNGNGIIFDLINEIRDGLIKNGRNVPHLKIFATAEDGTKAKASLIGIDYPVQFDRLFKHANTELSLVINVRAACESSLMDDIMNAALNKIVDDYQLDYHIAFAECFGMMPAS